MGKSRKKKPPAYAILAEDRSDLETLRVLVKRTAGDASLRVKGRGYQGCGELLRKGAAQIQLFANLGCNRFLVCADADGPDPDDRYSEVRERVVEPSGFAETCIVIPVQELEAWILADLPAVTQNLHFLAA